MKVNKKASKYFNEFSTNPYLDGGNNTYLNSASSANSTGFTSGGGLAATQQRFDVMSKMKELIIGDGDTGIKMVDGQFWSGGKTINEAPIRILNTGAIIMKDTDTMLDQVFIGKQDG